MNDEQIPFFNSKFYKNNYNEKEDIFNHFLSEKPIDNKYCCFHCLRKIPLFCCFFWIYFILLFILLIFLLLTFHYLINKLNEAINVKYFSKEIIDPIVNSNSNYTQSFNIRNKIMDDIILENKIYNLRIFIEFSNLISDQLTIDNNFNFKYHCNIISKKEPYDAFIYIKEKYCDYNCPYIKLFNKLSYYLKTFYINLDYKKVDYTNNNLPFNSIFNIKEIMIYNYNDNYTKYLTMCDDWSDEYGFLHNLISDETIIQNIHNSFNNSFNNSEKKEPFLDFFVENNYTSNQKISYLKFHKFELNISNDNEDFFIVMRMGTDSMINLFNKQNDNLTTIIPITNLSKLIYGQYKDKEYHFFLGSSMLINYFKYGIKNEINSNNYSNILSRFDINIDYVSSSIHKFYEIFFYEYEDENNNKYILYNKNWELEFSFLGQLFNEILKDDYNEEYDFNKSCSKKNLLTCQMKEKPKNIYEYELEYLKSNGEYNEKIEDILNDIQNISNIIISNYGVKKFGKSKIIINNSIFNFEHSPTYTDKKVIIYNHTINNMHCKNIEFLDVNLHSTVKIKFIKSMNITKKIIHILLICISIFIFILSLIILSLEIKKTTKRIKTISYLKDMLFSKKNDSYYYEENTTSYDFYDDNLSISFISNESKKPNFDDDSNLLIVKDNENEKIKPIIIKNNKKNNDIPPWDKRRIFEKFFFERSNREIVNFTYKHLKEVLENIDNYSNEKKFKEKLNFLKRKYKLHNEKQGKKDNKLASDIYQALSKLDIINLNDFSYNIYYNQSYALSQNFKMFNIILENAKNKQSVPLKNNKFINFEDIMKIIYYIKKEKIQKLIEDIYYNDLRIKHRRIEDIEYELENPPLTPRTPFN